ncbi:MAG: hypothetical protein DRR19_28940, partial [Candidatus Parabeggiatoa sp. nov. 1]
KKHAEEAGQRIQSLTEKAKLAKKREADETAWQTACQQNTQSGYQAYLNGNTLKKHADEVQQRLKALAQKTFAFEVVTVNAQGEITHREQKQARYETEDLGNGVALDMVSIPGGTFMMGSPDNEKDRYSDEGPQHRVTVEPFWMGKYPVTQAQWQAVMGNNPSYRKGEKRPVERISWQDAVEFCQRLSEKTNREYRLASEAEWEYACRAGTTTPFYFGETITTELANYNMSRGETTDVGSFPPNGFGLYDMHGNVWEWCADIYYENYNGAPNDGGAWLAEKYQKWSLANLFSKKDIKTTRLLRGGSFAHDPSGCRAANRGGGTSDGRGYRRGVRVVAVAWTF